MRNTDGDKKSISEQPGGGSGGGLETPVGENITGKQKLLQGEVLNRLKKIEGQVRGVYKMIEDCRSCGEIVIQLAAIRAAVNRVGVTVLACHMADKMEKDILEGQDTGESLNEFMSLFKKFS